MAACMSLCQHFEYGCLGEEIMTVNSDDARERWLFIFPRMMLTNQRCVCAELGVISAALEYHDSVTAVLGKEPTPNIYIWSVNYGPFLIDGQGRQGFRNCKKQQMVYSNLNYKVTNMEGVPANIANKSRCDK